MTFKNSWRRNNIGRRMNEAVRLFEAEIVAHLAASGHGELTQTHINLTRNLDEDGTRLTVLARRAAMTKQSMGELVDQIERTGLIERRPDPSDGRAKLICFTDKGLVWLEAFHHSLERAEKTMRAELGDETVDMMVGALGRYVDAQDKNTDTA